MTCVNMWATPQRPRPSAASSLSDTAEHFVTAMNDLRLRLKEQMKRPPPLLSSMLERMQREADEQKRREEERRQHSVDPDAVGAPPQNSGSLHGMCAEPAGMRTGGGLMSCNKIRGGGAPSDGGDHAEGEA